MFNATLFSLRAPLGLGLFCLGLICQGSSPATMAQDRPSAQSDARSESLRDPTRPLNFRVSKQSISLELNSILVGGDRRLAVINGQQLRENELVANSGGVRLKRIEARQVVLEQDGKRWNLTLAGDSIRRSRSTEN